MFTYGPRKIERNADRNVNQRGISRRLLVATGTRNGHTIAAGVQDRRRDVAETAARMRRIQPSLVVAETDAEESVTSAGARRRRHVGAIGSSVVAATAVVGRPVVVGVRHQLDLKLTGTGNEHLSIGAQ